VARTCWLIRSYSRFKGAASLKPEWKGGRAKVGNVWNLSFVNVVVAMQIFGM
jgi:hypothetical protein